MKKTLQLQKRLQHKQRKKARRIAGIRRNRRFIVSSNQRKHEAFFKLKRAREIFRRSLYKRAYNLPPKSVNIVGDFGIELPSSIDYFLDKASEIIDFNNTELTIHLEECTRVWPSAITLMCSLMQWVELSARSSRKPVLSSTASKTNDKVTNYLIHSGFYKYVNAKVEQSSNEEYSDQDIVKIQREKDTSQLELREDEVYELLKKHSAYSNDEIEWFYSVVLTEVFINVTEHGIAHRDKGWWILAQRHEKHGVISFCVADNGIGIRNTLTTGPQREDIIKEIENTPLNDGLFIKTTLEKTVSGALKATVKKGKYFKSYQRGSIRGNGIKRIAEQCKKLKTPLSILSHHGYVFINADGEIVKWGANPRRIFAGTMYHMLIPARRETDNGAN